MATSNTYNFNPAAGEAAIIALSRIGVKRTEILAEHMSNAFFESNLMQADWGADGITWWTVVPITQTLTQGTATYTVPANVVSVLDLYITANGQNRLIYPFSRTDFASLATPNQQGFPTTFWWNRVIPSTISLWPVPDGTATYTMTYYVYQQIQDAMLRNATNVNVPFFWLDAYVSDLSYRLSRHHAPQLEAVRKQDKIEAYGRACKQVENENIYVTPGLSGYYR